MIWRNRIWFLCALILSSALGARAQDIVDSDIVRPSGVNGPVRKAKAVTQKDADDETESAAPKAKKSKSSHARSHRARAKSKEEPDTIAAPTEFTPDGIPKTSAASVIVVDANSGRILYEKNPDQVRQAASTQKLLTALIVAETGFLDRPVTVQSVDTMCDPVKLGIKSGETYQRMDLLRALLVKSPNDVARCLARDNAGSVEAFAQMMNRRATATRSCTFALCESEWFAGAGTIFQRPRPRAHRPRCLREPDHPLHRLSSSAGLPLFEWAHARA